MNCKDCYWSKPKDSSNNEKICCNEESKNYNKTFTPEQIRAMKCDDAETKQAVDYRRMTPWEFACRYYM